MSGLNNHNNLSVCPACRKDNTIHGKAMTLAMTCTHCNVYYRLGSWNKDVTRFANEEESALVIGSKGRFEGIVYQVMGFVIKKEIKYKYTWREYLLFNPFEGYVYLSEYNGHWNIIWPLEDNPKKGQPDSSFTFENHRYELYQAYQAEVIFAKGEFFFDVVDVTETTFNREYISPPFVIGSEKSDDSHLYYQGEYLTKDDVAAAFGIAVASLPSKSGIGYTQPVLSGITQSSLIKLSVLFAIVVVVLQIFISSTYHGEELILRGDFNPQDEKMVVTQPFELPGKSHSLLLEMYKPMDNNWFVADIALINEATGEEYNFTKELEYYHGYEDGYSWTEGSQFGEAFLSKIPGGKYHINIYPEFGTMDKSFSVTVKRDISFQSNMWVTLLLIGLFPGGFYLLKRYYEGRRWADSEYTPYE